MIVGSGLRNLGGAVLLYRSADLEHWDFNAPVFLDEQNTGFSFLSGTIWECPQIFQLKGIRLMQLSVRDTDQQLYTLAAQIDTSQGRFNFQSVQKLDYGDASFYAAQSFDYGGGRRILFGWIPEMRSETVQRTAGGAGVLSLPRLLNLSTDRLLEICPAPELVQLRGENFHLHKPHPLNETPYTFIGVSSSSQLEIRTEIFSGQAQSFGMAIAVSDGADEKTLVYFDIEREALVIDTTLSSQSIESGRYVGKIPHQLPADGVLRLHLLLDHSVLEIFNNDRVPFTTRIYPANVHEQKVFWFARGNRKILQIFDVWTMGSIW